MSARFIEVDNDTRLFVGDLIVWRMENFIDEKWRDACCIVLFDIDASDVSAISTLGVLTPWGVAHVTHLIDAYRLII